jgi:peptidyl-prolyl cis-trans isomerase B (cyclophilin B)
MVASSKRERELARQRAARQAQRQAEQRRTRNLWVAGISGIVVVLLIVVGAFAIGKHSGSATASATTPATSTATPSASSSASTASCTKPPALDKTKGTYTAAEMQKAVNLQPAANITYGINFTTNCGLIKINLDVANAPQLSDNMVFLANTGAPICQPKGAQCGGSAPTGKTVQVIGYFDHTACHRVTTSGIFILQCGDPTGTGSGGPGYKLNDENLPTTSFKSAGSGAVIYPAGTVAMANSGANTNGSQFFIVYKDSPLAPNYSVIGTVAQGLDIVQKIAAAGVSGGGTDGSPAQPIVITKALSFQTQKVG